MPEPVHFFVHVPKCAGTTVEEHFRRALGKGFLLAPRWKSPLREVLGNRYPGLSAEGLAGVRLVSGHSLSRNLARLFPGRETRESVLLREPVGWFVSFWNYRLARHRERGEPAPPPFARWYGAQRRNPISRFLVNRYFGVGHPALHALSSRARFLMLERAFARFHFVGDISMCDEAVGGISRELGVDDEVRPANVGRVRALRAADLPEAMRARILSENDVDALLAARWAGRGFRPGAPEGGEEAAEALSAGDHLALLGSDIVSVARKKLWRPR